MPPLSFSASSTRSDLLRATLCQLAGLAWVMAIGRCESRIASSVDRSAECDMSITMPSRFISPITSRPMRVMPASAAS